MSIAKSTILISLLVLCSALWGQEVPILSYSSDVNGNVQLEVASSTDKYYVLKIRHDADGEFDYATSVTLGEEGTTIISEPLESLPLGHYQVLEYDISDPFDTDGDGIDDITEFNDAPTQSALNSAEPVPFEDGTMMINTLTTFKQLSLKADEVPWAYFLDDQEFIKFAILDFETDNPKIYFINAETHWTHQDFGDTIDELLYLEEVVKGEIMYFPSVLANNGTLGVFAFVYSTGEFKDFETTQRTYELLAANMPYLKNNLSYYVLGTYLPDLEEDQELYDNSRIPILRQGDVFADLEYLALNIAEGYGYLRHMNLEDTPGSRDVVIYEAIPNTLPRVGGIITSFIQTPLSHVNLRAIQDNLPNSYIENPLGKWAISSLVNGYVYYKVGQYQYTLREASLCEVNQWYDQLRPAQAQIPALDLSQTEILPLSEIDFSMSNAFGAKCANVATMGTFDFPEGTIPNGFGVPFYFYQEFMAYNGFFDIVDAMIADEGFQNDLETRKNMLKDLRTQIKDAEMPQWMLDKLEDMHNEFPEGTSVRCRSSTNNEDLPGFSGAGLYTSKTQHPHEGHIQKSIKQVYASMWNFRAFDERDFYRVDHHIASMGVLCHPNYPDEKANGVGVSTDPIYQTDDTYYLNTQVGEDLITNPEAYSTPEEILLDKVAVTEDDFVVIRRSNLVPDTVLIMTPEYLDQMRVLMTTIHNEFAELYGVDPDGGFAVDIEYKITAEDQLIVKQARPWVSYWTDAADVEYTTLPGPIGSSVFPNPFSGEITIMCDCEFEAVRIYDLNGRLAGEKVLELCGSRAQMSANELSPGLYVVEGLGIEGEILFKEKIIKY